MKRTVNFAGQASAVVALWAALAVVSPAQTLTTLFSFNGRNGGIPEAGMVQATNGDFYGTTESGGAYREGVVFKITPSGTLTTLYSFCAQSGCPDGARPYAGLIQATDGDLFGTTYYGGAYGNGAVFKITLSGTLTTIYSFCAQSGCPDGSGAGAGLIQATNGDLYGTTYSGGAYGDGTVFKITPSGTLTTLYSFCAQSECTDGENPSAGLIQATNGDLYGTTLAGGAHGGGTVFEITPSGALTTLYGFCADSTCADGANPYAGLTQATNGEFYGTTTLGGAYSSGTVFEITASGALTTLYSFCAEGFPCVDGDFPYAGLVQGTDGNLYGTTDDGGPEAYLGTIFKITPGGTLTTLYSFCTPTASTCGYNPSAGLFQATNGDFYGTTTLGGGYGAEGFGTVYSFAVGLGPFVEPQTTSGKVGSSVKILGTDLMGATSVTFNGTPAEFIVSPSGSFITATVPSGATTGTVEVVTPTGTLSSNVPFRVR